MVKRLLNISLTLVAAILVLLGLLLIFLPGPAILVLPLGIWLFNKTQPGRIDPYLRRFMAFLSRAGRGLDDLFKRMKT